MREEKEKTEGKRHRYALLDSIRGVTLLSMICYHAAWDLVYLFHVKWDWYKGTGAYIWQQSICWTFIFLSGFCWPLGRKPLWRGLLVSCGGLLVSVITCLLMPESRILFGVLTLIGSGMLLMIIFDKLLKKIPPLAGVFLSLFLFILTKNINDGFLGFESRNLLQLPGSWYHGMAAAYLGFTPPGFFSTDYFSLFPWLFLFVGGYFLCGLCKKKNLFECSVFSLKLPIFAGMGRYSFWIYLLHQPAIYGMLMIFARFKGV